MAPQSPVVYCTFTKTRRHKSQRKTNNRICRFCCVLERLPPPGISVTQRVNGQKLSDPAACILHLSAPVKKETLGPKGWTGSGIPLSVRHILVSAVAALGPARNRETSRSRLGGTETAAHVFRLTGSVSAWPPSTATSSSFLSESAPAAADF